MPMNPQFFARGNINPARFVKQDTATNFGVLQAAAATDKPIGISDQGSRQPPGVIGSDAFAAHNGEALRVYGEGDVTLLQAGTGGFTAGDYLKSDGSGQGVTIAFTLGAGTIFYGAVALETVLVGEWGRVQVKIGPLTECTA